MEIGIDLLVSLYTKADEDMKKTLEQTYGKSLFFRNAPTMECIKTFEDACEAIGEEHEYVKNYRSFKKSGIKDKHLGAYLKLCIITEALNGGRKWEFGDRGYFTGLYKVDNIDKYPADSLWLFGGSSTYGSSSGLACSNSSVVWSNSLALISARLAYVTKELAEYSIRQFYELWGWYLLNGELRPYKKKK